VIHEKNRRPNRECRIQAHMDQRAHMQNQTDVSQAQARGSSIRRHVAAHQRRLEAVGPVECRPTTMVGRVAHCSTVDGLIQPVLTVNSGMKTTH